MEAAAWVVAALVAGSLAYSLLVVLAAWRYRRAQPPDGHPTPPISILKPLAGLDEGLEENLRSFFTQDYPAFELLFGVRDPGDPAAEVARRLIAEYPGVDARLLGTGEPPYPSAKVYQHECLLAEAKHDLIVTSDSDVRVDSRLLRVLAAEFQDPALGCTSCPYRAVPGSDFWSALEAINMNTQMFATVLMARMLEGVKFGVGPTMAMRRETLEKMGRFAAVKDYHADDFVLGALAAGLGYKVAISSYVIEHRLGTQRMGPNLEHRLRWMRSTRRSRPAGYWGQVFTFPTAWAVLLALLAPAWWPLAVGALAARAASAWATAGWILADRLSLRWWALLAVEDLLSLGIYFAGAFGKRFTWRGHQYEFERDGTIRAV